MKGDSAGRRAAQRAAKDTPDGVSAAAAQSAASAHGEQAGHWIDLGLAHEKRGALDQARQALEEAVARARSAAAPAVAAKAVGYLGFVEFRLGHLDRAAHLQEEAQAQHAALGLDGERAEALANLANVRLVQGREEEAAGLLDQALDLARAAGAERVVGSCLGMMGNRCMARRDLAGAQARFCQALATHERTGWQEGIGIQWMGLAQVHEQRGQIGPAQEAYGRAQAAFKAAGHPTNLLRAVLAAARTALRAGEPERARQILNDAVGGECREARLEAERCNLLGEACVGTQAVDEAEALHLRAQGLARALGDARVEAVSHVGLAEVARCRGRKAEAVAELTMAASRFRAAGLSQAAETVEARRMQVWRGG